MNKQSLRHKYKKLRAQLSEDTIDDLSMDIANRLLGMPIWEQSFYHIFLPIKEKIEVNTECILHILQGKDKNVVLSKSNFADTTLEHLLLTDATVIQVNSQGIPEPVDGIPIPENKIEVVFIPLLAYDQVGNRVGYGKGFYDLFLSKCSQDTIKIGVSFFEPEENIEDILLTDICLDYCVTPLSVYVF